ncbi:hypothetical protein DFP72DRAFT_1166889 [Ephemerocybe angulata]|uniref:Uncharacterized protein n=1 Tax=Ephemerocybe angulata TaxID=980116 RepID=A0A8H6I5S9_9AGAR|nr:hypothetical protein DFP72DRAFT_1166889 [Tulosesus angulatus]
MTAEIPRMNVGEGPKNAGRTLLVGGTAVAAILYASWYRMKASQRNEEAKGTNPYYEQVQGSLNRKWRKADLETNLKPMSGPHAAYSSNPPALPIADHHSGRMTISEFNEQRDTGMKGTASMAGAQAGEQQQNGAAASDPTRYMVPPPQRGRNDGSGRVYTKSPDYAMNYHKTIVEDNRDVGGLKMEAGEAAAADVRAREAADARALDRAAAAP